MFNYTSEVDINILEDFEFDEDEQEIIIPEIPKPSPYYCSTLAIQVQMNCTFDCDFLYNNIILTEGLIHAVRQGSKPRRYLEEHYKPPVPKKGKTETSKKGQGFPYQASIVIPHKNFFQKDSRKERRNIDIMLFKTGCIIMTGLKDFSHVDYAIKQLRKILMKTSLNDEYSFNGTLDVSDIKVNLMNCHFDLGFKLNRRIFFDILKQSENDPRIQNVVFDPDKYQGIKLYCKIKEGTILTCLIFDRKINLTGGKGLKTVEERKEAIDIAYNYINEMVRKNYKKIFKSIE
jgi:TATA-box binding protein (TBP) (component of TFIID and TFIIIB)